MLVSGNTKNRKVSTRDKRSVQMSRENSKLGVTLQIMMMMMIIIGDDVELDVEKEVDKLLLCSLTLHYA